MNKPSKNKDYKKAARKLLTFLGASAITIFCLNFAIDNPWTHDLVRNIINDKIEKEHKLRFDFQTMEVSAIPLGATLYGLKITPLGEKEPRLKASKISAFLSLFSLAMGKPKLDKISINELHVSYTYDRTPDGKASQKGESKGILWPPPVDLPVKKIDLFNANITFKVVHLKKPKQNLEIRAHALNLSSKIKNWDHIKIDLESPVTDLRFRGAHILQGGKIEGGLSWEKGSLSSKDLKLASHDLNSSLFLSIKTDQKEVKYRHLKAQKLKENFIEGMHITIQSQVENSNLTAIGRFLNMKNTSGKMQGSITTTIKAPFVGKDPIKWQIEGTQTVKDAKMDDFWLYDPSATFNITEDAMTMKEIVIFKDGKEKGRLDGIIKFNDKLEFDYNIHLDGLTFLSLLKANKVRNFNAFDGDLYSKKAKIKGQGFPFKMDITGDLYLRGVLTPSIKIKKDRFKTPPDCLFHLSLFSDTKKFRFDGTSAHCMDRLSEKKPVLPIKLERLFETAKHLGEIKFNGDAFYQKEKGLSLTITSKALDIAMARYFSQVHMEGLAAFENRFSGPYSDLLITNTFSVDKAVMAGFPVGFVKGVMKSRLKDNRLNFENVIARPDDGGSILVKKASLHLDKVKTTSAHFVAKDLRPSFIRGGVSYQIKNSNLSFGIKELSGNFKGPLFHPILYEKGRLNMHFDKAQKNNELLFSNWKGSFIFGKKTIKTKDLIYTLGGSRAKMDVLYKKTVKKPMLVKGNWLENIGGSFNDWAKINVLPLEPIDKESNDLSLIPFAGKHLIKSGLSSNFKVSMQSEGKLNNQKGHFTSSLLNLKLFKHPISDLDIKGKHDESQIDLTSIRQKNGSLVGSMHFDYGKEKIPYKYDFTFNRFDLRAFGSSFFFKDPRNYAYLTGSINMQGHFKDFWRSRGAATISAIAGKLVRDNRNGFRAFKLQNREGVKIKIHEDGWDIEDDKQLVLYGKEEKFVFELTDNRPPHNLNIVMQGDLSASSLKHFIPKVESSKGFLQLDGKITGKVEKPDVEITIMDKDESPFDKIKWTPLSLNLAIMPPPINNIGLDITYRNGVIEIEKLEASKGSTGKIQASGSLDFSQNANENSAINIGFSNIDVRRYPIAIFTFDAKASGNLVLSGNKFPLNLAGNIKVDQANSLGDFDIRSQLLNSIQKQNLIKARTAATPTFNFDMNVAANQTIKIRNRNMVATLSANLKIKGTESEPIILGNVDISEGKFFYKRDFRIRRGSFIFVAANYPPDPRIDVVAEAVVNQYIVRITISGYSSQPKVEMTVDPPVRPDGTPINKVEMLLLLTQGKLPTKAGNDISNQARKEALNIAISQFEQPIERLFDMSGQSVIRQVYFDMTSDQKGRLSPRINLPFHFTDDVNIIIQVDNKSNFTVSSEYAVDKSISLNWSIDEGKESDTTDSAQTDSGVDLKFRFNFP